MEVPRHWRLQKQRYSLTGEVCPHCDAKIFPARDVCPECGGEAKEPFRFSGKGEVYSYTVMNNAPAGFERNLPYTVALVKLAEGPTVTAQLTDLGDTPCQHRHARRNGHPPHKGRRRRARHVDLWLQIPPGLGKLKQPEPVEG